jgi:hypothetical protein
MKIKAIEPSKLLSNTRYNLNIRRELVSSYRSDTPINQLKGLFCDCVSVEVKADNNGIWRKNQILASQDCNLCQGRGRWPVPVVEIL